MDPTHGAGLTPFPDDFDTVLCVVAHPDDIEYGTAAAVAKWTAAGKTVTYFLLTRGEAGIDTMHPEQAGSVREAEERASAAVVGVDTVEFGDHHDGVIEYGVGLRRDITAAIRRTRPDLVLTLTHAETFPGGFLNQADHRAVGLATIDATADAGNRWIFSDLADEGLEPWKVSAVGLSATATPTHFVDVTGHLDDAIESLEEHRLYNAALPEDFPRPPELLGEALGEGGAQVADPAVEHALLLEVFER